MFFFCCCCCCCYFVCFFFSTVPAEVTHFSITPRTVLENHTLTITCTVIGNPVPQYSISHLYYTNTSKLSGTVTFTSRPTVCRYSGLWTCSAENTLNDKTSTEAAKEQNVTVLCKLFSEQVRNYLRLKAKISYVFPLIYCFDPEQVNSLSTRDENSRIRKQRKS